jgi:hypothetical protein
VKKASFCAEADAKGDAKGVGYRRVLLRMYGKQRGDEEKKVPAREWGTY